MQKIIFAAHCLLNTAAKVVLYEKEDMAAEETLRRRFLSKPSIVAYSLSNYPVRNSRFMEPAAGDMLVISLTILFFAIIAVNCWRHIFCK